MAICEIALLHTLTKRVGSRHPFKVDYANREKMENLLSMIHNSNNNNSNSNIMVYIENLSMLSKPLFKTSNFRIMETLLQVGALYVADLLCFQGTSKAKVLLFGKMN